MDSNKSYNEKDFQNVSNINKAIELNLFQIILVKTKINHWILRIIRLFFVNWIIVLLYFNIILTLFLLGIGTFVTDVE